MRKVASQKRQAVKELKFYINQGRKIARQINRKIDTLAQLNKLKAAAKERLIKLCNLGE